MWILLGVILLLTFLYAETPVTAVYTTTLTLTEDTYLEEKFPDVSPWNNRNLYLGTDSWYGKGKTRILLKPNFSLLAMQQILPNDIEKVELLLTSYAYQGTKAEIVIDSYTTTSPWSMFSATWSSQPTITSSKKDTTIVSTNNSRKSITVTNAFLDAYRNYPTTERGIQLKVNAETEKAIIFWAQNCDAAPEPPHCSGAADHPLFKLTIKPNSPPSVCSFKTPAPNVISNNSTIAFEVQPSIDPDNDSLTYHLKVCRDTACNEVVFEQQVSTNSKTYYDFPDDTYYVSCLAFDGHDSNNRWSSPHYMTVDSIPPISPIIVPEPSFTGQLRNVISWSNSDIDATSFQVVASERQDFKSYNTYSPWIQDVFYTFEHTKEKTYYYKVRSRDKAGNESEWSHQTSTTIDATFPTIRYFRTNKTLLSPKKESNGSLSGTAYLQGGIDDANIGTISLFIRDHTMKKVYETTVDQKSYLWLHWPETTLYPDGTYLAQLTAHDLLGNEIQSDIIFLEIDTTPPTKPRYLGISNTQTIKSNRISFEVRCQSNALATVYVSGKIIAQQQSRHLVALEKKDGSYTTKATCTDVAGNKSETSLSFSIDTTPPSTPSITFLHDEKKKQLTLQVYCREDGATQFYKNGFAFHEVSCLKGKYATTLEKEVAVPYTASFTARVRDKVGNWSDLGEKTVLLRAPSLPAAIKPTIACSIVYHKTQQKYLQETCALSGSSLLSYQNTIPVGKHYVSTIEVNHPTKVSVTISIVHCLPKSFWDPRTWFSCVEEPYETITQPATATPVLHAAEANSLSLTSVSQKEITATHEKTDLLRIATRFLVSYSFVTGNTYSTRSTLTQKQVVTLSPRYTQLSSKQYFSWLFSGPRQVSQWYGNTAYQKPHAGIDFSVAQEKILAPAEGTIVSATYHKASSCFAGGYYLAIKHPNGLYTYYFHLKNILKQDGKTAYKPGNTIKRGAFLATSGNSGMYNCEPLAAHLHFELRSSQKTTSHLNPVPYFSVNWNTIVTAKAKQYPGRLTGENPHPQF